MTIKVINKQQHKTIEDIQKKFKILTLQNKGYEKPNKEKFTEEEKEAHKTVENILKNHIVGFSSFSNFKHDKNNNLVLRVQYNYNADNPGGIYFVGVGYLQLKELLNGFNK